MIQKSARKRFGLSCGLAVALVSSGCSTSQNIGHLEGHGKKQVFAAPFDRTWKASIDAIYGHRLTLLITNLSPKGGFISAEQPLHYFSFGENVGVWVIPASPTQTKVEVVSRYKLPPLAPKNWERPLLQSISTNLGQRSVAETAPATNKKVKNTPAKNVPDRLAPAPNPVSTNPRVSKPSATNASVEIHVQTRRELEQRLDQLSKFEESRTNELEGENDARRREHLQSELDYVRSEIRAVKARLSNLKE